jgi:hypothetical protein
MTKNWKLFSPRQLRIIMASGRVGYVETKLHPRPSATSTSARIGNPGGSGTHSAKGMSRAKAKSRITLAKIWEQQP